MASGSNHRTVIRRIESIERRLFPRDSKYQRLRRRRVMLFSLLAIVLLVIGTMKLTHVVSATQGRTLDKGASRVQGPFFNGR